MPPRSTPLRAARTRTPWRRMQQQAASVSRMLLFGILPAFALVLLLGGVYWYLTAPGLQVQHVTVTRTDPHANTTAMAAFIRDALRGQRLYSFSSADLSAALLREFPDVKNVVIERSYPGTVRATITRYQLWAIASTPISEAVYISEQGRVQSNASNELLPGRAPAIVLPRETIIFAEGQEVFSVYEREFLDALWRQFFATTGAIPEYIEYYRRERTAIVKANTGFETWYTTTRPLPEQMAKWEEAKTIVSPRRGGFGYIDVRPIGRFIVCRGEERCRQNKAGVFLTNLERTPGTTPRLQSQPVLQEPPENIIRNQFVENPGAAQPTAPAGTTVPVTQPAP